MDLLNLEKNSKRFRDVVWNFLWPKKKTFNYNALVSHAMMMPKKLTKQNPCRLTKFANKTIKKVFSRATNICEVDLTAFTRDLNHPISLSFLMVPTFISLNLSFIKLDKMDLINIAKHCPLLEELSLENSLKNAEYQKGLKSIFIKCLNIKYLNLSANYAVNGSECFRYIPTQLKFMNISSCTNITMQAMGNLGIRAKNLETLILSKICFTFDINVCVNWFRKLKFLELSSTQFVDFSNLKELEMLSLEFCDTPNVGSLQTLQHCSKLKSLDIKFYFGPKVNIFGILINCQALKYLHVYGNKNHRELLDFVQNCQLKYLSISKCGNIDANIIKTLLTECESLTHLEFTNMRSLNYDAIVNLLKDECFPRQNILKLVMKKPPFKLPSCKWCEIFPTKKHGSRVFGNFTDVKKQYDHKHKSRS